MVVFTYQDYLKFIKRRVSKSDNIENLMLREESDAEYLVSKKDVEDKRIRKKVNNPHDKIFRTILEDKKQVIDVINNLLKLEKKLEENEIERYNSSYISKRFENKESDIVYKMKEKNIFFLIEHQSKIDYKMSMRIMNYEVEIMRQAIEYGDKIGKNSKIPMIVPIVIYTGKRKWNAALSIEESQEELQGYQVDALGKYNLIDINDYTIEELEKGKNFISKMMVIEKSENKEELIKNLSKIIDSEKEQKNVELLYRIIQYILKEKLGKEITEELLKRIKGGNENMGLAVIEMLEKEERNLKRRIRKSCNEAKLQGITLGKIEIVKEMIKNNTNDNFIKKVAKMDDEQLEKIKKELKQAK